MVVVVLPIQHWPVMIFVSRKKAIEMRVDDTCVRLVTSMNMLKWGEKKCEQKCGAILQHNE